MNNKERYDTFNNELRKLLTLYEEIYKRDDGTYKKDSGTYERFEENPSALFVVYTEFIPKNPDELGRVKIHYDINHRGSKDFNNLLDAYNMEMEWDNSCIFLIYDAIDELNVIYK